ncbi:polymorphic toxin type 50 domain-containing protein [Roseateles chitinivorans]|uniref:polymorphic toxin type 50 domain-containing protein n=1 Tax=Roseateles chitinivorans TaxID=2917965 RepID=UPI003D67A11C
MISGGIKSESAPEESKSKPPPQVEEGKQGKHQPEHNNFIPGRSELTHPDPQGLVDENAGTGQQVGDKPVGEAGSKERVDFKTPIGNVVENGKKTETTVGIIHYSNKGVHIVPARPSNGQQESK